MVTGPAMAEVEAAVRPAETGAVAAGSQQPPGADGFADEARPGVQSISSDDVGS
jgi:hypothetical protein